MQLSLSVEQADALRASLRYSCSRLSRMAGAQKSEPSKRAWAAERAGHLAAILTMLDKGDESMADETYNGWTNRETWAANLHITNDQGLMEMATERLESVDKDRGPYAIGNELEEWFEGLEEDFGDSESFRLMLRDVGSVWRVNWQEIAEGLLED